MHLYRLHLLNPVGEIVEAQEHSFRDDLTALDKARALCEQYSVEIFKENRRIARVKRGDAPLTERDGQSL